MRQSQLFTKTRKDSPKDEVSKNADLLIRAGYIHKEIAGVYSFLPLGLKVLKKIEQIIRVEMNKIGGQEIEMTALQSKEIWEKTGRWDDAAIDIWFKTKLKNNTELGLGFTHEEPLTNIMRDYLRSFRDFPVYVYQFQTKFRNETRAKSGIMRGREFLMKDLYSFSRDQKEHEKFYEISKEAYMNIFDKVGIRDITYLTFASGGSFSKYSHEFQTISKSGEDTIFVDENNKIAINKEVLNDEVLNDLNIVRSTLTEHRAVEVGNIFSLGTRFSEALELFFTDEDGTKKPVVMGSYGLGPSRLMGVIAEVLSDDKGLVWPESVAPFDIHLISLGQKAEEEAVKLYDKLVKSGKEVLYDDRDMRPGEKFADSDLIGIPTRIVISDKTIEEGVFEVKNRKTGEVSKMSENDLLKMIIK